tara:strand:+ start:1713 stop:2375 length:663 start_codon:yes stop_codon:yes gene_type:complete
MIHNIFPTPIYTTIIKDYNKSAMIDRIHRYIKETKSCGKEASLQERLNVKSYFGDTYDGDQIHNIEEFYELNNSIGIHTKKYLKEINVNLELLNELDIYAQKSWLIRLRSGGNVAPHTHPNAHLSCVFYIQAPEGCGKIEFLEPPTNPIFNLPLYLNQADGVITPKDGMLIIFPSSLHHMVHNSLPNIARYSVSYDLMCASKMPEESVCLNPKLWKKLDK